MVTGVSEKERGRGREKKIIITFHSVTKKRIELFKTKYFLKRWPSFLVVEETFTHHGQFVKEIISVKKSKDFQSWMLLGT